MAIDYQIDQRGVATVTLNRAAKRNAFDDHMIEELSDAFNKADQDPTVRVLVLRSTGKHFSAGADLAWMQSMVDYSFDENLADANKLANMLASLNQLSKPTIARVQGAAFGGAVGLVSCCDIAIGTSETSFCLSEVKLGLVPATIENMIENVLPNSAAAMATSKKLVFELSNRSLNKHTLDEALTQHTCEVIARARVSDDAQQRLRLMRIHCMCRQPIKRFALVRRRPPIRICGPTKFLMPPSKLAHKPYTRVMASYLRTPNSRALVQNRI